MNIVLLLLLMSYGGPAMSARILAVLPIPAKSHHILFNSVLRTLAQAGHQVVCYSGLPADQEVANLTVIHMDNIQPVDKSMTKEMLEMMLNLSPVGSTSLLWMKSRSFIENMKNKNHFQQLLKSNEKFDLIILEAFFSQESLFALGHKFKAPIINLQPFGAFSLVNRASGNSLNLAYIPDFAFPSSNHMSFYERTLNAYSILSTLFKYYFYFIPSQDQYMRELFNDYSLPPLSELMQNWLALTFSNAHPYVHYVQPYTPNIIPIGGIHLAKEQNPLPEEMKRFLDKASEGVVYFSVGSIVPDHLLDEEYFNNFLAAFSRLPQKVLWKTKRNLKNLPKNIMTSEWVPQQDVLAHPNVKVFMTHGGMFSQHEVIRAGVPVICTPYFGDQPMNAKFYEEKGIGVVLPFKSLSEETILSALKKVLDDPKYKDNMLKMSMIYQDRPLSPKDTLLYWVDYVMRHAGAKHLTPAAAAMPFYQVYLLDVIGLVSIVLVTTLTCIYVIIKRILGVFTNNGQLSSQSRLKGERSKKLN
ncbi:UDP-glycosyltransferase UGT5-like [Macrosteles quadrilineatus]|uniref:UDP-glycosyltransferase UGT5-like n=1 Tax=Macrosteles quadrilineatus TaxID=74068 RepID=UPI0023E2D320|nr:UDP-glycosyltransferase UGT5-like [Macrosteles quadrilineatus]XP_054282246.1 UDP-glycosyltransferase UGT5-like [Macrosteles quadrilineatus]